MSHLIALPEADHKIFWIAVFLTHRFAPYPILFVSFFQRNEETSLFLPVLNIRENEFRLRTDTAYFLSKLNIPSNLLIFRDQLNLFVLKEERKLALTLVDYNVMTGKDAVLDECVVSVFDHHIRERPVDER